MSRPTIRRLALAGALALALTATAPLAHEGAIHAKGTVSEVTATQLVLKTTQGETKRFRIGAATRFLRGEVPATVKDVRQGERAAVHARPADGEVEAYEVRLAPATSAR